MSPEQRIGGDERDRTLPAPQRSQGGKSGTPALPRTIAAHLGWNIDPDQAWDLLEHSPSGFVVIAGDGSVLYANQSFLKLIGRDVTSVAGFRIQDFLTPGGTIFYETQFMPSLLIRGSLLEIAFDFLTADGERVPTLVNARLKAENEGAQSQIALAIFGAKQRRLYEAELLRARREAEELSEVVRRSSDGILRLSTDDQIGSWNRGAEQIFGYSAQDAIGNPLFLLICEENQEALRTAVGRVKSGEEASTESVACRNTGERVNVSISLSPHMEAPGILVGYSAIIRNVTERKLAEKALLQSEKLASVGRLASSIAHEINNPLEAVTNLLYILASRDTDDETQSLVRTAQEELARVSQIATYTLRFHKQSSSRTDVDIRALFESVTGLYRPRLKGSGIKTINDADDFSSLVCFEGELRQILVNLVANAFDAMRSGGILVLRSRKVTFSGTTREGVRITIADTGSGMEPTVMKRLFEPFVSTKGIGGTGLGLWITKDLVQKNQGSIRIRSSTRERRSGTVVSMRFPSQPT